jgi:hypothetical protein
VVVVVEDLADEDDSPEGHRADHQRVGEGGVVDDLRVVLWHVDDLRVGGVSVHSICSAI